MININVRTKTTEVNQHPTIDLDDISFPSEAVKIMAD